MSSAGTPTLLEAFNSATSHERTEWIDRLLEFNDISNDIREKTKRRSALAKKLGVPYSEIIRRENEEETKRCIARIQSQRTERIRAKEARA